MTAPNERPGTPIFPAVSSAGWGTGDDRVRRWLVVLAVAGAVAPVAVAAVRAVRDGWIPVWDNAYPAIRARDVFSANPPLLGTRSSAAEIAASEHSTHHLGPMEFYLLAPWVRLFGTGVGTVVGVALVNLASIVTAAWLAFRRGGHLAAVVAMATMAGLAWSFGSEMLYDPWPIHVVLLPFSLVLVAAWSVADRDLAAVPVLALSASFVLQTHSGYLLLVPGVMATAAGLAVWRMVTERGAVAAAERRPARVRRLRWVGAGAMVALVSWLPPLYEQVAYKGGNLTFLLEAMGGDRAYPNWSLAAATRLFAGTLVLPPWWLPPSLDHPAVSPVDAGVSLWVAVAALAAVAVAAVTLAWRAYRRGRWATTVGLVLALVTPFLVIMSTANSPARLGLTSVVYLKFVWVSTAFVCLMLALAVGDELRELPARRGRRLVLPVMATAAVTMGLLALPRVDRAETGSGPSSEETSELVAAVLPAVADRGGVLVEVNVSSTASVSSHGPGLIAALVDAGVPVVVRDEVLVDQLGEGREYRQGRADVVMFVMSGWDPPLFHPDAQMIASVRRSPHRDEVRRLRASLAAALDEAHGLPVRDVDALAEGLVGPTLAETMTTEVDDLVADLEAVGTDPDDILDAPELVALVTTLDGVDLAHRMIEDGFPVDDLVRYSELRELDSSHYTTTVWLDPID